MEDKQRRMGELVALLNRAAYAYYTKDEPIMADVQPSSRRLRWISP